MLCLSNIRKANSKIDFLGRTPNKVPPKCLNRSQLY